MRSFKRLLMAATLSGSACLFGAPSASAADHGDAPNVASDSGADINDVFAFLDPNDNTQVVLVATFHGFIVPSEAANFGSFDDKMLYRFDIENTGDAKPDATIEITFNARTTAATQAQTASVKLPGLKRGVSFTAPTTPPTLAGTPVTRTITTDPASGVKFFAGPADDPFFFDIPAFSRWTASVTSGSRDDALLTRGRDSFAGYNTLSIALSFPLATLRGASTNNIIGVQFVTARKTQSIGKNNEIRATGRFKQVDRMGNPGINVALIPFARKTEYNSGTPIDDAKGRFAPLIVTTLSGLGTNNTTIDALAGIVVTRGDYLHLDVTKPNTGNSGGTNPEAAFPNGRRLADDTIDIVLTSINNGTTLGDSVNASDVPPINEFPFLALPQQPRDTGVTDDLTRN